MADYYEHIRTKKTIYGSPVIENQGQYTNAAGETDFQKLINNIETSRTNRQHPLWIDIGNSPFAYESARKAFDAVFKAYNKHKNSPRKVFTCILRPNLNGPAVSWPKCFVVDYDTKSYDSHIFAIYKTKEKLINTQLGVSLFK